MIYTYMYHFWLNYQCFYKQWYERAAQSQNMTFSKRSHEQESLRFFIDYLFKFLFYSARVI